MNYIIIGALLAIGWHLVKLVYCMIEDVLFSRLHKAKWFAKIAGVDIKSDSNKSHEMNKIGFH